MKIYALVTLYYPKDVHVDNLRALLSQVDKVIVCDNSPNDNSSFVPSECSYTSIYKNLGLSAAFNRVLKDEKYGWSPDDIIIFFDQDSRIAENHVKTIVESYNECAKNNCKVGCIGPVFYNIFNNEFEIPRDKKKIASNIYEVKSIITSSMMCKYKDLQEVGFWNEEIFLDMADWDLCWRLMQNGFKCCMTSNVFLLHTVGTGIKKIVFFRMRVAAPIREYYEIRECLYMMGKKYTPFKYKLLFIAMLTVRNLIHVTCYDEKKKRLHYIVRGIKDFLNNIHGEFKDAGSVRT